LVHVPRRPDEDKVEELLQTLIVLQLFALGTQDKIAKVVGRGKLWVNTILKGLPPQPKPASGGI
jgi:hypothetical protein